jgi:hypothetical protein
MSKTLDAIRTLYFNTTKGTIQKDLTKAITLFKSLEQEADREKAAVFMDGLSQMRSEWGVRPSAPAKKPGTTATVKAAAAKKATAKNPRRSKA